MSSTFIAAAASAAVMASSCAHAQNFGVVTALLEAAVQPDSPVVSVPLNGVGLAVAVDGETIYMHTAGDLTPATQVSIASATKWLSGALIMSLVDDGVIGLDQPLGAHLAAFAEQPDKAGITFAQAFSHTSGLPGQTQAQYSGDVTLQQAAAGMALLPLNFAPGEQFGYGGTSMHCAGAAAEAAAGRLWTALFAERIADPLGLSATDYNEFGGPVNPAIGGGARSSLQDYLTFLNMVAAGGAGPDGEAVLSPAAVEAMLADQSGTPPVFFSPLPGVSSYGVGVWRERVDAATGEVESASSPGAFGTYPWYDVERGYVAVFVTESTLGNVTPLVEQIRAILNAQLPTPACAADLDGDGDVDSADLNQVLNDFGAEGPSLAGDVNDDGEVGAIDLNLVLASFGDGC